MLKNWLLISMCLFVCACGGPGDDTFDNDVTDEEAAEEEGVFDPMVGTLERAEDVQNLSTDRKNQMDEALDE